MSPLEYSRERLRSFVHQVEHLKDSDFPLPHSKEALDVIESEVKQRLKLLDALTSNHAPDVVHTACIEATGQVHRYFPLLGIIIRSTNVRNSFEVYQPLLRLARKILGQSTKLILSSEWEFSPYVYVPVGELPDYVLIGLPSSEANNPLLIPLAGHEIGHKVWGHRRIADKFLPDIGDHIYQQILARWAETSNFLKGVDKDDVRNDLFVSQIVARIYVLASRQAEETFCDFIGIRIFGSAFFYAFAYLIAPGLPGFRPEIYPNYVTRANNNIRAAKAFGTNYPTSYDTWFRDAAESGQAGQERRVWLSIADSALVFLVDRLIAEVRQIAADTKIPEIDKAEVTKILSSFRKVMPAAKTRELSHILAAAWEAYHDEKTFWPEKPKLHKQRVPLLRELVLKNIEVLEFEERTKA